MEVNMVTRTAHLPYLERVVGRPRSLKPPSGIAFAVLVTFGGCIVQPPTYADLGIEKTQAMRWQLEAEIPESKFEQFIAETKAAGEELTSIAAIAIAKKIKRESDPKPVKQADRRSNGYVSQYGNRCWELDAIDPYELINICRSAVEGLIEDKESWLIAKQKDALEREDLGKQL